MTGRIIPLQDNPHRKVEVLLPWYLTGRLDAAEEAQVREHLAGCLECQAELNMERRLALEMADLPSPVATDADAAWARMRRRIEAERPAPSVFTRISALRRRMAEQWDASGAWLRWAVAGQACLLALGVGLAGWQAGQPAGAYRALASASPAPAGNLVVVFRPETPEVAMRQILRASHARLVDGPTQADAYVLQAPASERTHVLTDLRRRHEVVLAEPIDPPGPGR